MQSGLTLGCLIHLKETENCSKIFNPKNKTYSLNKNKDSKSTFLSTQSAQSTCLVLIALLKEKDRDRKTICYFCIACIRVPEGRGKEGDTCETSKLQRNEQIEREGEEREEVKPDVQSRCSEN